MQRDARDGVWDEGNDEERGLPDMRAEKDDRMRLCAPLSHARHDARVGDFGKEATTRFFPSTNRSGEDGQWKHGGVRAAGKQVPKGVEKHSSEGGGVARNGKELGGVGGLPVMCCAACAVFCCWGSWRWCAWPGWTGS